jgi:hypothetical protein
MEEGGSQKTRVGLLVVRGAVLVHPIVAKVIVGKEEVIVEVEDGEQVDPRLFLMLRLW